MELKADLEKAKAATRMAEEAVEALTPKEHLEALSHSLCLLKISKIFSRSLICSDSNLILTTMSSI